MTFSLLRLCHVPAKQGHFHAPEVWAIVKQGFVGAQCLALCGWICASMELGMT